MTGGNSDGGPPSTSRASEKSNADQAERVRAQSEYLQQLVNETIIGKMTAVSLVHELSDLKVPEEAQRDLLEQVQQGIQRNGGRRTPDQSPPPAASGSRTVCDSHQSATSPPRTSSNQQEPTRHTTTNASVSAEDSATAIRQALLLREALSLDEHRVTESGAEDARIPDSNTAALIKLIQEAGPLYHTRSHSHAPHNAIKEARRSRVACLGYLHLVNKLKRRGCFSLLPAPVIMAAKPQIPSDTQDFVPESFPNSYSSPAPSSPSSKKRKFESTIDDDGYSQDFPDTYHKTRRVNPQRLAVRLGAELVAEMEELIYPGAKMPTFEVRKVFQEKYHVDRRHIYDYFHSRGLRVAKEDKHTNLTRGRMAKVYQKQAQENKREAKDESVIPLITKISDASSMENTSIPNKATPVSISTAKPVKRVASKPTSSKKTMRLLPKLSKARPWRRSRPPMREPSTPTFSIFSLASSRSTDSEDDFGEEFSPAADQTLSPLPDFTIPSETAQSSVVSCGSPPVQFDPDFLYVPDSLSDFGIDLPPHYLCTDSLITVAEHRPLTASERMEMYNMIHKNIGPPQGIEESKGSYHAYMEERTRRHLSRVSFVAGQPGSNHHLSHSSESASSALPYDPSIFDKLSGLGISLGKPVPVSQLISSQQIFNHGKDFVGDDFSELVDFPRDKGTSSSQDPVTVLQVAQSGTANCNRCSTPQNQAARVEGAHSSMARPDTPLDHEKTPASATPNNFRSLMFSARLRSGSAGGGI